MKKLILIIPILLLTTACTDSGTAGHYIDENNAPGYISSYDDSAVMSRIMDIKNGATPKVKPTGSTQPAAPTPPPAQTQQTRQTEPVEPEPAPTPQLNLTNEDIMETINKYTQATFKTSLGDIKVKFYGEDSPKTVANFLKLAEAGFYDNTRFHRVIADFMIQGGDPQSRDESKKMMWGTGGPGYQFEDEFNDHKLVRGSLAMANSGPDTNGSQFFIVTAEATPWLDGHHTNFGEVVEGMEIVDKIGNAQTDPDSRPLEDVIIEGIDLE